MQTKQIKSGLLYGISQFCHLILRVHSMPSAQLSTGAQFWLGKDLRMVLKKVRGHSSLGLPVGA